MTTIVSGTGNKKPLKVDDNNRAAVFSVTETETQLQAKNGKAWNINTGLVTIADGADHAILYFKNGEPQSFVLTAIAVGVGTLSSPSERTLVTLVRNPTTGTIVDGAVDVDMRQNRDFGSSLSLGATTLAYKGGQANTFTDGSDIAIFHTGSNQRLVASIDFVIPQTKSVGIKIDLNAAAGGQVYAALIGHLDSE